jgi:DNA polymerase-3 subunit epsilon
MSIIKIFYDVETTGVKPTKHSIHQIAGGIEVDGLIHEEFNFKVRPHPKAKIEKEALAVSGVTEEQVLAYLPMKVVHGQFITLLSKYIDRFDSKSKAYLVGYNNRKFDDIFLRAWFEQCGDVFFGSWFWSDSLDVICFASEYLSDRRAEMPSFKLHRVAKELGIQVDDSRLHDALYDVIIMRQVYMIVTGRQDDF